jgi:hypothetical protein
MSKGSAANSIDLSMKKKKRMKILMKTGMATIVIMREWRETVMPLILNS